MLATGVAALDPHYFGKPDPYLHQSENQIRIRIKVKRRILIQIRTEVKDWQKESRGRREWTSSLHYAPAPHFNN
jgi:hypothetical protein